MSGMYIIESKNKLSNPWYISGWECRANNFLPVNIASHGAVLQIRCSVCDCTLAYFETGIKLLQWQHIFMGVFFVPTF